MTYLSSFHDTISTPEQLAMQFDAACKSQEDMVIEVFRLRGRELAYFEVAADLPDMDACSLKRAITNLTKTITDKTGEVKRRPMLRKTAILVTGPKGKACHRYELIKD